MKKIICAFLLVAVAVSCGANRKASRQTMNDSRWLLTEIAGKAVDRSNGPNAVIKFSLHLAPDNHYNGLGDCNRFFGSYTIEPESRVISFDQGAGISRMMCTNQAAEDEYIKMLTAAESYDVDGDVLILKDQEGGVIASFRRDNSEIGAVDY